MMDGSQFDAFIRSLTGSRRSLLGGSLALATGWLGVSATEAKKKHKKRKPKKPKPNAYGCLEVGDPCQNEEQCCSGICDGKKGKRKCRAHDTETCDQKRPGYCAEANPYLALCNGGSNGACFHTTAGSNVCANDFICADCQRDVDCEALGHPPGSACAPFGGNFSCADLCANGMACIIPIGAAPPEA